MQRARWPCGYCSKFKSGLTLTLSPTLVLALTHVLVLTLTHAHALSPTLTHTLTHVLALTLTHVLTLRCTVCLLHLSLFYGAMHPADTGGPSLTTDLSFPILGLPGDVTDQVSQPT